MTLRTISDETVISCIATGPDGRPLASISMNRALFTVEQFQDEVLPSLERGECSQTILDSSSFQFASLRDCTGERPGRGVLILTEEGIVMFAQVPDLNFEPATVIDWLSHANFDFDDDGIGDIFQVDFDHDGIENAKDSDDDNDGLIDWEDNQPWYSRDD